MKQKHAWGLFRKDGKFIAAFRFRPKRVYIPPFKGDGDAGRGYYAWTDCNGPRCCFADETPQNIIEGSWNATCKKIAVPKPIKSRA